MHTIQKLANVLLLWNLFRYTIEHHICNIIVTLSLCALFCYLRLDRMMFGGANNSIVAPVPASQVPVMVLRTEGSDAVCGCPCCGQGCVSTVQFQNLYFVPPETGGKITQDELTRLTNEGNEILRTTHMPPMPIIFMHFCIPFSPICIISCYAQKRESRLKELCEKWNKEVFLSRGCHM